MDMPSPAYFLVRGARKVVSQNRIELLAKRMNRDRIVLLFSCGVFKMPYLLHESHTSIFH